ncbi:MAG: hypothetical protein R3321_02985 [Nitrososphaeraceae archaeon]|nr:hypothetical protein [Nitrososphaeraceae archaeon]
MKNKAYWEAFAKHWGTAMCFIEEICNCCPMCKYKSKHFEDFCFHFHSTHGIPRDVVVYFIEGLKNE